MRVPSSCHSASKRSAQIDLEQNKGYYYAKEVMSMNAMTLDVQQGMTAFLEKRKPCWVGK